MGMSEVGADNTSLELQGETKETWLGKLGKATWQTVWLLLWMSDGVTKQSLTCG
jgi:hypothetical protein